MKKVGRDSSVHPKTLQNLPLRPRAKRKPPGAPPAITVLQVHPGIWATALEIAGGDASLIQVISPTRVIVSGSL